jgi:hypothetical protein
MFISVFKNLVCSRPPRVQKFYLFKVEAALDDLNIRGIVADLKTGALVYLNDPLRPLIPTITERQRLILQRLAALIR